MDLDLLTFLTQSHSNVDPHGIPNLAAHDSIFVVRSASRHLLAVPQFQLDTYGRRTFAVAGPTTWNLFRDNLHEPDMRTDCLRRALKTVLFEQYSAVTSSALETLV